MAELRGSGPPSLTLRVLLTLRSVGDDLAITGSSETHDRNVWLWRLPRNTRNFLKAREGLVNGTIFGTS